MGEFSIKILLLLVLLFNLCVRAWRNFVSGDRNTAYVANIFIYAVEV